MFSSLALHLYVANGYILFILILDLHAEMVHRWKSGVFYGKSYSSSYCGHPCVSVVHAVSNICNGSHIEENQSTVDINSEYNFFIILLIATLGKIHVKNFKTTIQR